MGESLINEKRKALLYYKQKLLTDMGYFDSRIREARNKTRREIDIDWESSDSDVDMTANIDLGPKVSELKQLQSRLKTCLQATEELTGVHVLESQVEVVVQEPVFQGLPPIKEDGTWYEVVAECKLDLVHFLITFFVHKSHRKFGPTHYRGLKVNAVKKAHELELSAALTDLDSPGSAVKLVCEFACCHRARRTSLARLADKFAGALLMAPRSEGGFTLKCLDVLEMWWIIKYSRSKGTFNHSLKFDIDHMDDNHLQIIKQYYQQLDPSIGTDKRTLLLEKIIHTCIESKGTTLEMYESTESDQETIERQQYNRKILDNHEVTNKNRHEPTISKDSEIMAPPKALPKKTKPKGKENKLGNDTDKTVKRPNENSEESPNKKPKKGVEKVASNQITRDNTNVATNENMADEHNDESHKDKEKHVINEEKLIKKTTSKEKTVIKGTNVVKTSANSEKTSKNTTKKDKEQKKTVTKSIEPEKRKNEIQKTTEKIHKVNQTKPAKNDQQKPGDDAKVGTIKKSNNDVKIKTIKDTAGTVKEKSVKNKKKSIHEQVSSIDKLFEERTAISANVKDAKTSNKKKTDSSRKSVSKIIKRKSIKDTRRTFTVANDKPSPRNKIPTVPPKTKLPAKQPDVGRDLTGVSVTSVSKIPQKTSSFVNVGPLRISPRKSVQTKPKTFKTSRSGQEPKKTTTQIPRLLKKPEVSKNIK